MALVIRLRGGEDGTVDITTDWDYAPPFSGDETPVDYPFDKRFSGQKFVLSYLGTYHHFVKYLVMSFGGVVEREPDEDITYFVCSEIQCAEILEGHPVSRWARATHSFIKDGAPTKVCTLADFRTLLPDDCWEEVLRKQEVLDNIRRDEAKKRAELQALGDANREEILQSLGQPDGRLRGLRFVVSGDWRPLFSHSQLEETLRLWGATVEGRVTGSVNYLVLAPNRLEAIARGDEYVCGKYEEYKRNRDTVTILTLDDVWEMLRKAT